MKTAPLTLEQIELGERLEREAADRLRRCRTEPPIEVYCPKSPGESWTSFAPRVTAELRDADRKVLADYAVDHLAELLACRRRELEREEKRKRGGK